MGETLLKEEGGMGGGLPCVLCTGAEGLPGLPLNTGAIDMENSWHACDCTVTGWQAWELVCNDAHCFW